MPEELSECILVDSLSKNLRLAEKVVELAEQGLSRTEIIEWLKVHLQEFVLFEDEYLNDFHKSWNESKRSMHFSHEYLKAQSRRLESIIWLCEAREGRK